MADLLGPTDVRNLSEALNTSPSKKWGQNFVVDAGTVRRIVRIGGVTADDHVVEVGPGLGSLTLALLETGARVTAVEIDPILAAALAQTVAQRAPEFADNLTVVAADAMKIDSLDQAPTALVANLPYNVSVPVILHFLETFNSLDRILVMVQSEVADRLAAPPGSRTYGIPSAKAAWYCSVRRAGNVGRAVFWPVPRVDSALVLMERREVPKTNVTREQVWVVIDAAFAHRRKGLRGSLADLAGGNANAEEALVALGIEPLTRGEALGISDFVAVAEELARRGAADSDTLVP